MAVTPSAQYSVTLRVTLDASDPAVLGRLAKALGDAGGDVRDADLVESGDGREVREIAVNASSTEHADELIAAAKAVDGVTVEDSWDRTFRMHEGGKLELSPRVALDSEAELADTTGPGVEAVCKAIADDRTKLFDYTLKRNMVAVITNGTAVLGLGDIGAAAGMPVMEGKSVLFKEFGDVDSYPICVDSKDPKEIIAICKAIAPAFGGINLEDIGAPTCF